MQNRNSLVDHQEDKMFAKILLSAVLCVCLSQVSLAYEDESPIETYQQPIIPGIPGIPSPAVLQACQAAMTDLIQTTFANSRTAFAVFFDVKTALDEVALKCVSNPNFVSCVQGQVPLIVEKLKNASLKSEQSFVTLNEKLMNVAKVCVATGTA